MQIVVKKRCSGYLSPQLGCSIQPCVESWSHKAPWGLVLGSWLQTTAAHQHRDTHLYEEMHFYGGEQLVLKALLEHDWFSRIFLSAVPAVRGVPALKPEASPPILAHKIFLFSTQTNACSFWARDHFRQCFWGDLLVLKTYWNILRPKVNFVAWRSEWAICRRRSELRTAQLGWSVKCAQQCITAVRAEMFA